MRRGWSHINGVPALASLLAQVTRQEGLQVDWTAPEERRGIDYFADIQQLVVTLTAVSLVSSMRSAVGKFRKRTPRAKADIEGDEDQAGNLAVMLG
jgi:hypothetical protein